MESWNAFLQIPARLLQRWDLFLMPKIPSRSMDAKGGGATCPVFWQQ